jgi:adenine-specific DNA-methyltransferase
VAKHSGRLELTWAGKDKALLSAGDGKYDYTFVDRTDPRVLEVRVLQEVGRCAAPSPSDPLLGLRTAPTHDNLLITGDALHALDALRKTPEWAAQYVGRVKLVYIDPPVQHGASIRCLRRQHRPLHLADDASRPFAADSAPPGC